MQTVPRREVSESQEWVASRPARAVPSAVVTPRASPRDEQFLILLRGFRRSGGLARGRDLVALPGGHAALDVGSLARWMVEGQVIHLEWQDDTWFPVFQFDGRARAPRAVIGRVLAEFAGVFDAWETAQWFARPCPALGGHAPADAVESDPEGVWALARCDRFVVAG
jgi:hypothetical protein